MAVRGAQSYTDGNIYLTTLVLIFITFNSPKRILFLSFIKNQYGLLGPVKFLFNNHMENLVESEALYITLKSISVTVIGSN